jgi:hypothetical protein
MVFEDAFKKLAEDINDAFAEEVRCSICNIVHEEADVASQELLVLSVSAIQVVAFILTHDNRIHVTSLLLFGSNQFNMMGLCLNTSIHFLEYRLLQKNSDGHNLQYPIVRTEKNLYLRQALDPAVEMQRQQPPTLRRQLECILEARLP